MKFSVNWLKQWVAVDVDADTLADELTAAGLEVDAVTPVAAPFSGVVVGEITACAPHPDADKLKVCTINDGGDEPLQVVCGAPNAAPGLKMPFARVGARLGADFKIRKARLRGVESFGMCCSARELGLSEDHDGLMALPADAPVGTDFRDYLGLDDASIDVDLTPNRADCLGIKGLARDVAAIRGADYTPLDIAEVPAAIDDRLDIRLDAAADCPRYVGRTIRGIDPTAVTPLWMKEALRRSGIRSLGPVVDATNYVLMELGQPMHAFDLGQLDGGITVRRGRKGETLTLLDDKVVELDERLLAICDDAGPVALAGIMGGLDSSVTRETTDILLESAWFRPSTIMGKARDLGLHTDASHRYERGVDPMGQRLAVERITALLLDIVGGQAGPVIEAVVEEELPKASPVRLRLARLNRVLGSDLPAERVRAILCSLGMQVTDVEGGWEATAPSSRFDIEIEEDLIEEVARVHGYDQLPAALPSGELQPPDVSEHRVALPRLRDALCAAGYQEAITYAFVDRALLETLGMAEQALPLANPISSDMDVMRTGLLPGLLSALARNQRRQQGRVRLFEAGKVFHQGESLVEIERIAAVATGDAWPEQWTGKGRRVDFFDIKGDLEQLLALRGASGEVGFGPAGHDWLHPGQSAQVTIDGEPVGWVGAVHPAVLAALEIKGAVFAFEIDALPLQKREVVNAKEISPYPSVRRDLAFLVPDHVNYRDIRALAVEIADDLLAGFTLFDQFSGESVEKGYKSMAIGLILQDVSCTLTDEVVDGVINRLVDEFAARLDAQLRG
ncbi:phenylalanine--tRNA ligase subunit beta [Marinihelvus fidelis]|uniref:Phenylalanine--tRNA ligase beta subunit n=1 Tax=Marinihelvus fidelis TaxID=2613842 RepID=A0A5N0TG88_9GAMM|nr:phenylalanine--tRNA ligase subunit beta [Marinihelvus fidelis]KAA9133137.1 phenylalanine--tRNA ligase subunit beta [Marinihelvus fidelis]